MIETVAMKLLLVECWFGKVEGRQAVRYEARSSLELSVVATLKVYVAYRRGGLMRAVCLGEKMRKLVDWPV